MTSYRQFIFESYNFDTASKTLSLHYSYDGQLHFTERYHFDFDFVGYSEAVLDRALQNLFYIAGVSYYKAFLAPEIIVSSGTIDQALAEFLSTTYQEGLGEFFYVNQLDPRTPIHFPVNSEISSTPQSDSNGLLIGLGGGKDSLVTVEALRSQPKIATWSVGHRAQLEPLVAKIGLPHFWVEREWDKQLLGLTDQGAYNGHVPISAILAAAGTVVAVLTGYQDVVVSNEHSANEATLDYQGVSVNHQYSKSEVFERTFQAILLAQFGSQINYYSFLRPLSELRIAGLFSKLALEKYTGLFSSCNKAYTHGSHDMFWCGLCPKCAFVYLALANFTSELQLTAIFGHNLLLDPLLEPVYRQLLGIQGEKPLDCVGEIQESRFAMLELQKTYPQLLKYEFELSPGYDYRQVYNHSMPDKIYSVLKMLTADL